MIAEEGEDIYFQTVQGLFIGTLIGALVLGAGGTGTAINPARDLGPRIAHFVLPISGKGSSEWWYGWIPAIGPFIGAAIAAGLWSRFSLLNTSPVQGGFYDGQFRDTQQMIENICQGTGQTTNIL